MRMTQKLRELLRTGPIVTVSAFDALSARLAELAGFEAIHLSGFASEAALLGAPDMGILSMGEIVAHASRIVGAINIPMVADIDTGFGGANNIARTIREMERVGVAGIHIEDQSFPKRCPVLDGRIVISIEAALGRIGAAVDARQDEDFLIVARSDADAISIEAVIERCNLYLEAGADMVMPAFLNVDGASYASLSADAQMSLLRRLASGIRGPVMSLGVSPPDGYTTKDMCDAGFTFIMLAGCAIGAVASALADVYREVRTTGTDKGYFARKPGAYDDPLEIMKALRLDQYVDVDRRFSPRSSGR